MGWQGFLLLLSIAAWWGSIFVTDGEVMPFAYMSGLMLIPVFILSIVVLGRDGPPFYVLYGAACFITVAFLLRGETTWTLRSASIAAALNMAPWLVVGM